MTRQRKHAPKAACVSFLPKDHGLLQCKYYNLPFADHVLNGKLQLTPVKLVAADKMQMDFHCVYKYLKFFNVT